MVGRGWILTVVAIAVLALPAAAGAATVSGTVPAQASGAPIVVRVMDADTTRLVATQRLAQPGPFSLTVPAGLYMVHVTAGDHFASHSRLFRLAANDSTAPEMVLDRADPPPSKPTEQPPPQHPAAGSPPPPAPPSKPTVTRKKKKCKKPPPRCKKRRYARTKTCRKAKRRYAKCRKAQRKKARRSALARPAIGVKEFGVSVDGRTLGTAWHLVSAGVIDSCIQSEFDHVEVSQMGMQAYENEVKLQQQHGDPANAPDPSRRIHATHHITGEGAFDASGNGTLTLHLKTVGGTHVASVTVSGHLFDAGDAAARKLGELLCRKLRVQFAGERHNRLDVYACPPPNPDWFHHYDGEFTLDTPAANRFVFPRGAGWTNVTGTVHYVDTGDDGVEEATQVTGDSLEVTPAGDGKMEFWLRALSFNPALERAAFTAGWGELVAGPTTWPVNISWDSSGKDRAGCTFDESGTITGTFTVTPQAAALQLQ
jgi:hypothetical protein